MSCDFRNFRTDLYEPQWSYTAALERGWIPRGSFRNDPSISGACAREDDGDFLCVLKKGQIDSAIRDAVGYALDAQNITDPQSKAILNMTGTDLRTKANEVIGDYFDKFKHSGATCDFGGVAQLTEQSHGSSDDDTVFLTDDEYYGVILQQGPKTWVLVVSGIAVALLGGLTGFVLAMRYNPGFNEKVRKSRLFMPLSNSKNSLLRSSLKLPTLDDYDEIQQGTDDSDEREGFVPVKG